MSLQIHSQTSGLSDIDERQSKNYNNHSTSITPANHVTPKQKKLFKNSALVFIKPHASKQEMIQSLVKSKLLESGIKITFEFTLTGEQIERRNLIDRHYYLLSKKALSIAPKDLKINEPKFAKTFHETWSSVINNDNIYNANQASQKFKCDAFDLLIAWEEAERNKKVVKLAEGCYCGFITIKGTSAYVINAFYLSIRLKYMSHESFLHAFLIEWNSDKLSWKNFRHYVIGDYDPERAVEGSIRRIIFDSYATYGLAPVPNKYDNIVHASASAFEALSERCNWLGTKVIDDDFGKALLFSGITESALKEWFLNPLVPLSENKMGSIFQIMKDMDSNDCLEKAISICDVELELLEEGGGCNCSIM